MHSGIISLVSEQMLARHAEVSELADEQDWGSCGGYTVWVQVPSSAWNEKTQEWNPESFRFRTEALLGPRSKVSSAWKASSVGSAGKRSTGPFS